MVSSTPRSHFTPGKDPLPILQEDGWTPGPVWTGEKSRPHRDSIPNRPTRSQSLYRLSYPAHTTLQILQFNCNSFSSFVHTNALTLCAVRAEFTGFMIGLYLQCDRHRHFSLSSSLGVYVACYRVRRRVTSASSSMALCQSRK